MTKRRVVKQEGVGPPFTSSSRSVSSFLSISGCSLATRRGPPSILFLYIFIFFIGYFCEHGACLNHYVDSYQTLNYRPVLDRRKKRSIDDAFDYYSADSTPVDIRFNSHNRTFHLKLLPIDKYTNVFAENFIVDVDGESLVDGEDADHIDHLYEGHLKDDPFAKVFGSIIDGIFDGHIFLRDGRSFTVEKAARYFDVDERPSNFHSIIYQDDEISHSHFRRLKRSLDANTLDDDIESGESDKAVHHDSGGCGMTDDVHQQMRRVQQSAVFEDLAGHYSRGGGGLASNFNSTHASMLKSYLQEHVEEEWPFSMSHSKAGIDEDEEVRRRVRRAATVQRSAIREIAGRRLYTVRTCTMYLQADQKLYEQVYMKEGNRNKIRTREEIVGLFFNHVKAVNQIYEATDFGGVHGLNFIIQRTSIYTKETCLNGKPIPGSDNPFCEDNVDVSNYLNLNSQRNHSAFCLAYALTFRDFVGGTLGLAWVASPTFSTAGGICQVYQKYNEGQHGTAYRSLNTGIITLVNYGNRVPLRVSQLTMAHEIGHNFGSPHDQTAECQPGLPDGNYIMFASATSGDKVNNAKFSKCSVQSISQVLYEVLQQPPDAGHYSIMPIFGRKRNCFQERTSAFCGNQIYEPADGKEECDCGFSQRDCDEMGDRCCAPREMPNGCKRTPGSRCSPSEGLCCRASTCNFYTAADGQLCREESECLLSQRCDGRGAACPDSVPKPDGLPCQDVTKVCQSGSCNGSICAEVGLKDCFLTVGKPSQLCHLACEKNGTCYSSFELPEFAGGKFHQSNRENQPGLLLHPGSPCNNYKGYCDILRKCRSVDSNGPLARLKNLLFNRHTIKTVSQWMHEHWWACVLIGIGILLFMALFVKCCAVHTPSTNPNKIPAQHFSDTLRHPGTLLVSPPLRNDMFQRRGRTPRPNGGVAYSVGPPTAANGGALPMANGGSNQHHPPASSRNVGGRSGNPQNQQRRKSRNRDGGNNARRTSASSSTTAAPPSTGNRQQAHHHGGAAAHPHQQPYHHHHAGFVAANRAPLAAATPVAAPAPLITAPNVSIVPNQSLHEPPPPYTPIDPSASITPSPAVAATTTAAPPPQSSSTSSGAAPAASTTGADGSSSSGGGGGSSGVIISGLPSPPSASSMVPTPLPGAPLPPPPVLRPPIPAQGPKPGRRKPKNVAGAATTSGQKASNNNGGSPAGVAPPPLSKSNKRAVNK